jgi:pimeloyl-ACP methyl ester carboxylesterase
MECELENITIYYEMYGEGRPILMLHGGYTDHRHMVKEMEPLFEQRNGWKRIYPDLPGHGKTPAKDWITSHDKVLEIIFDFVGKVIPGQCFAIAGVSRGGYLGRGIIYKKPELVDGVLFLVPALYAVASEDSLPLSVTLVKDEALIPELEPHEEGGFELLVVQSRKALDKMREYVFPAFALADDAFQTRMMENYEFSFDVDDLSAPFEKPTLILVGRQDSMVGYRDAWKMLESYPRATFAVLDKAGHFLGLEQEELFLALANEWLQRVEEFVGSMTN